MGNRLWPAALVLLSFPALLSAQGSPVPGFHVREVSFENAIRLSAAQKSQITAEIRELERSTDHGGVSGLSDEIEQLVQSAYADKAFWRPSVRVELAPARDYVGGGLDVTVRAMDEGHSYRLHDLAWKGVTAFPVTELTSLLSLDMGHPLERDKIADGMEAIRRKYIAAGYLSFTATPEIRMNDTTATADVEIQVDEGGVFTVQGFDIVGVTPEVRTRLMQSWPFRSGDIYRGETVENFIYTNASMLPPVSPADAVCRDVDLSNHTINFVLDFRPKPQACSPPAEIQVTTQNLTPPQTIQ